MIRPNPAKGNFNIFFADGQSAKTLEIYDSLGRLMVDFQIAAGDASKNINLDQFAAGTYLVKLLEASGKLLGTEKLQVQ